MSYWEEVHLESLRQTTVAERAMSLHARIGATGVNAVSIIKPSYYAAEMAALTASYVWHVDTLVKPDCSHTELLKLMIFLRETCRTMIYHIKEVGEPLERLISILEDELEASSHTDDDDEERENASGGGTAPDIGAEAEVEREAMGENKDRLESSLHTTFARAGISDSVSTQLASRMAEIYLECLQFHREVSRLLKLQETDIATILSILIDLQFGLDIQLRNLLMEDFSLEMEPTFTTGFYTWSAQFMGEMTRILRGESEALVSVTAVDSADVIIIGAGIMGTSIACALAARGRRVTLLERGQVGSGLSSRSGSLSLLYYDNAPEARLALYSLEVFRNWSERIGGECPFVRTGLLVMAGTDKMPLIKADVPVMAQAGVEIRMVLPAEIRNLAPGIQLDGVARAAYEAQSGYVVAPTATRLMGDAGTRRGAQVREGVEVRGVRVEHGRVVGVDTADGPVGAPIVIDAAGVHAAALALSVGVHLPIHILRGQIAFFRAPAGTSLPLMVYDRQLRFFARPHQTGQFLMGMPWAHGGPVNPDDYDPENDDDFVPAARNTMARRFPALGAATYVKGWAGLYDMTPDEHCILDGPLGVEGFYVAAGFSGSGFKIAPAVGEAMASLVLDGHGGPFDLAPFRLSRFAVGTPATVGLDT